MPSHTEPRKESWFGSFGLGRKSTENVFGGIGKPSFNLNHEVNSPNTGEKSQLSGNNGNQAHPQNHRFSLTGHLMSSGDGSKIPARHTSGVFLKKSNNS